MALTRNEYCVHERRGEYRQIDFFGPMGNVVGPDIDLRFFLTRWAFGFAVADETKDGTFRYSLQFFDAAGMAIHKVYLEPESDVAAFHAIVEEFRDPEQTAPVPTGAPSVAAGEEPDSEIDLAGFRAGWEGLQDTHEFFGLLKRFKVARRQALRLIGSDWATAVAPGVATALLRAAAESKLPIMVFVGNPGMIQIHTGPVSRIVPFGDKDEWINVLDDAFNLHLLQTAVDSAWVVRKPTRDGQVTSVELFDAEGELVVQFFGKRKPGEPELEEWRAVAARLEAEHPAA
jgi:putative hemin transport protein